MITKKQLRMEIALKRKELSSDWQGSASTDVLKHIQQLPAFQSAKTIGLYLALSGEVRVDPLLFICRELNKQTCVPVYNAEKNGYEMAEITDTTSFIIGNYGIKEPLSPNLISSEQIDLIIVPGVAFDLQGNRLGRGGGYYDRILDNFLGTSVAAAFDFQILSYIPTDPHDKPVDFIITPTKSVKV